MRPRLSRSDMTLRTEAGDSVMGSARLRLREPTGSPGGRWVSTIPLEVSGERAVVLGAGGEFIRSTGFQMPVEGVANAYVPGILTAAGAFTLFGTVYAAH